MSRTRRVISGALYGYVNTAVITIIGLWLTPFLLGRLGTFDLGLWFVLQQAIGYLLLMDLGVVALLPREVAFLTGRTSSDGVAPDLGELTGRTLRLVLLQTPAAAAIAIGLWLLIPEHWSSLRGPAAVLLVSFVVLYPMRMFQAVLTGLQDLAFVGRATLAAWSVNTVLTVVLVMRGWGLRALVIGWAAGGAVMGAACCLRVVSRFRSALPSDPARHSREETRRYLASARWVSVSQVAQVLLTGTDVMVIGWLLGPAAVVPYACTGKLVSVLANQPQTIMQAAAPALSEVRAGESPGRLACASTALTQAMLLLTGAVACVLVAVNGAFVSWWVGPDQFGGNALTLLLVAGMVLRHWNTTAIYALFARGYDRHIPLVTMADGAVTVAAAAAGVWAFGPAGAACGAIAGASLVSLPVNMTVLARDGGFSLRRLLDPLVPWAVRFVPLLTSAALVAIVWQPAGVAGILLTAAVVGSVYAAVAAPIAMRAPLAGYLRPWLAWR